MLEGKTNGLFGFVGVQIGSHGEYRNDYAAATAIMPKVPKQFGLRYRRG